MAELKKPVSAELTSEQVKRIREVCQQLGKVKGKVLPILHAVQDICGNWLPLEALQLVAKELEIPYGYLYGVLTFYSMYSVTPRGRYIIRMCESAPCHVNGAENILEALKEELGVEVGGTTSDGLFTLELTACLGTCEVAPAMQINEVVFGNLTGAKVKEILDNYRAGKEVDYRTLARTTIKPLAYPLDQDNMVLFANLDRIDPMSLDDYRAKGGYEGLKKAVTSMSQVDAINEVKTAGVRGRGGAGFPAGLKWSFTQPSPIIPKYIVCNADEGEPGTIKDRYIMEGDPHRVLEGMALAGYAVGASHGYIYVRGEYYLSMLRLQNAIDQAMQNGCLGKNIFGSDFSFTIEVQSGGGAYVCGEETALIESIEGKRGNPRVKPPFPGQVGVWGKPSIVNNVETLSSIPMIISKGGEWYKAKGTEDATGTKIFQVVGHVNQPGVIEADLGMTVRELIDRYGGGIRGGKKFKACQTGGASFGFITEDQLDTPMEYKAMGAIEGALGSGTMLVMDEDTCIVDVVKCILYFFQHESCGFCLPCRRGTRILYDLICKIADGRGEEADLDKMIKVAQVMADSANCALAMSPIFFIKTTIERYRDDYLAHLNGTCPLCKK
ncbi:NADH-quinone oxidoreductase subunit NuoF [Desulfobacca acetoxidans]|uniref:NADH dehydrogenase (Quinone) n=1 Tax=Desulfobacca acetoxidans (strain ATCC 700848 / DSM 11109 / ASRB2) TaxID=880072 RepID=F2NK01_DESAR|nr:NADH-quinone oxidoreductase subunit NuoF [Desulfobacca acetoxidans]AEB09945.1 NADH dehydrogenase (quinone) [Desulfobacca acetoxidans DSM 11109]